MIFTPQSLLQMATRDYILGNTTLEEQIQFIEDQIKDPFNSGDANYLKKLKNMGLTEDEMDETCQRLLVLVEDVYSHLKIDLGDYDQHFYPVFDAIYKFFVKKVSKLMYVFLREFLFNNKNRRALTDLFLNIKLPTYPKEQYGKKEFYILLIKLDDIIAEIFSDDDVKLKKFIHYIEKSGDSPLYVDTVKQLLEEGIIVDNGVVTDMYKMFRKSDWYNRTTNKLQMDITHRLVIPYMEENGMMSIRIPQVEDLEEDITDQDEEDDGDD